MDIPTRFRFIEFIPGLLEGSWNCQNRKTKNVLGTVDFFSEWKKFVFEAEGGCVFDEQCLADIATFLSALNRKGK